VAVISDTTGYGTASVTPMCRCSSQKHRMVYQGDIDAANPISLPKSCACVPQAPRPSCRSVNPDPLAHINARGRWQWTCRSSARPRSAPARPGPCWKNLILGQGLSQQFPSVCYSPDGKLADRTTAFLERLRSARIDLSDTLLWWVAVGYDSPHLIAEAMKMSAPNRNRSSAISTAQAYPGVYGDISFTPERHDGYPDEEVSNGEVGLSMMAIDSMMVG